MDKRADTRSEAIARAINEVLEAEHAAAASIESAAREAAEIRERARADRRRIIERAEARITRIHQAAEQRIAALRQPLPEPDAAPAGDPPADLDARVRRLALRLIGGADDA